MLVWHLRSGNLITADIALKDHGFGAVIMEENVCSASPLWTVFWSNAQLTQQIINLPGIISFYIEDELDYFAASFAVNPTRALIQIDDPLQNFRASQQLVALDSTRIIYQVVRLDDPEKVIQVIISDQPYPGRDLPSEDICLQN